MDDMAPTDRSAAANPPRPPPTPAPPGPAPPPPAQARRGRPPTTVVLALALLLAGPSLSLPNMLVIRGIIGSQKTAVYVALVVVMATLSGLIYGSLF